MDDQRGSYKFVMYCALVFALLVLVLVAFGVIRTPAGPVGDDEAELRIRPVARFELVAPGAAAGADAAASGEPKDPETVYATVCSVCHDAGVAGAPKLGDKAAWAPRIATGKEALYHSALMGKGAMPARGGAANLSDDEVKHTVDLMLSKVK